MYGRKRPIPEIHSTNGMIRAAAERLAVNTPLQGSQADIIKKAMIEVHEALKKERLAYMVLQVHDELIFELPDENIPRVSEIVQSIMENITALSVPLIVNIDVGKNWGSVRIEENCDNRHRSDRKIHGLPHSKRSRSLYT